jgi:SMC interacting uncharacterized protein involved in chromosome segregation
LHKSFFRFWQYYFFNRNRTVPDRKIKLPAMDTYNLKPENMRAPDNLSEKEIRRSLDELDSKIKTLQARVHATTADSHHTYHEHIAALEAKRALIAGKLDSPEVKSQSAWDEIKKNINNLGDDLKNLIAGFGK